MDQLDVPEVPGHHEEALEVLKAHGVLLEGHFELSSGLHSPHYFQCAKITENTRLTDAIASRMAEEVRHLDPAVVAAPALGGIIFGSALCRALNSGADVVARNIFAERPDGTFEFRRGFAVHPGERVVLAENVVTTGGSVLEVADLVRSLGGAVAGYAVIVDRSGGRFAPPEPVISYVSMDVVTWQPDACPLCANGVPLEKPGSRKR